VPPLISSKNQTKVPNSSSSAPKLKVGVLVLPEFTLTPLAIFLDSVRLAADESDRSRQIDIAWQLLSAHGSEVRSSCGATMGPCQKAQVDRDVDCLVIAGGRGDPSRALTRESVSLVQRIVREGKPLITLCRASLAISQLGLLAGKNVCAHWMHRSEIQEAVPTASVNSDTMFVRDGNIVTCAGGLGAADVADWLIESRIGHGRAVKAARILLFDRLHHRNRIPPPTNVLGNPRHAVVRQAMHAIEVSFNERLDIDALASRLGLSRRHLERAFKTDLGMGIYEALRRYRLTIARNLIRDTDAAILEIAFECGFSSSSNFTLQFRQVYGTTPRRFRQLTRLSVSGPCGSSPDVETFGASL
jgi:transcriptional regulator GlxA family with amidase domain